MRMRLPRWVSERTICRSGSKNAMFPPMTIVRVFEGSQRANSGLRDVTCARRHGLMRVVFDTSVIVAAARSRDGASYALVSSIPSLHMILELAFAANCRYIVTHNMKDFRGCQQLGVEAITPREFLAIVTSTSAT